MIDVPMCYDNRRDSELVYFEHGDNPVDLGAGIDHDRLMRILIAENRAIALKQADRQYLVNHSLPGYDLPRHHSLPN
jgi:hypothetical protein